MAQTHSDNDSSMFSKLLKGYTTYKFSKGILGVFAKPLAISGIAYYVYRKFKQNRQSIA